MKYKIEFLYVLFLNIVIEDGIHRYIKDWGKEIPQGINKSRKKKHAPNYLCALLSFPASLMFKLEPCDQCQQMNREKPEV